MKGKNKLNAYEEHEIEGRGDYKVKNNGITDLLIKIAAVFIAFFIWMYAASQEDVSQSKVFADIPVEIATDNNYTVLNPFDYTVDVTVTGRQRELNKLSSSSFEAVVDATGINSAGKYTLDVNVTQPSSAEITEQSLTTLVVELDKIATAMIDVEVKLVGYDISDPYEIGEITTNIAQVQATGPSELLSRIACVRADITAGHLENTTVYSGTLTAVDDEGDPVVSDNLKLSDTDVTVTVPVYLNKVVPLRTVYKYGYYSGTNVSVTIEPASVTIKGEASVLNNINDITLNVIDEKKVLTDTVIRDINVPDGAINVSGTDTATVKIKLLNTSDRVITIDEFTVNNPNEIEYTLAAETMDITLRGPSLALSYVTASNITATIDLSGAEPGAGSVTVPVTITMSGSYKANVYELGAYTITVNV